MSKCKTRPNKSIMDVMIDGGFGYGKLCIPKKIVDLIIIIIFPPLYVILYQSKQPKFDIMPVIINIILSSCFYFPGYIHALNIKSKMCGSLFKEKSSDSNYIGDGVDGSFKQLNWDEL